MWRYGLMRAKQNRKKFTAPPKLLLNIFTSEDMRMTYTAFGGAAALAVGRPTAFKVLDGRGRLLVDGGP
jgi:hypothetical protein